MTSSTSSTTATHARPAPVEIPGFRIEALIASGGMGDVYVAQDDNLRRRVAIKFIHPEFSNDPEFKKRFMHEAQIVATFRHPNIVTIHASGYVKDRQYIVMEYVAGGTLEHLMRSDRISGARATVIAHQLADALAYAHERKVIHRDFKPANVLLRDDGTPLLSDFGIAKSTATSYAVNTVVGEVVGNLRYMAPEQARGEPVTDRVDVYSFGLVLYEMLVGSMAEPRALEGRADERRVARKLPSALAPVVVRCLQAEAAARPAASECRDALDPGRARQSGAWWRTVSYALAFLLAIAAGLYVWLGRGPVPPPAPRGAAQVATINLTKIPSSARIFVDRQPTDATPIEIPPGRHQIAALAPSYYGEVRDVDASGGKPTSEAFDLVPTTLPTLEEHLKFLKLADQEDPLSEEQVSGIKNRTLNLALLTKRLRQTHDEQALRSIEDSVGMLKQLGDARAAVASALIESIRRGYFRGAEADGALLAASQGGDAMASFFIAVAYRDAMSTSSALSRSDPRFSSYCGRLSLSINQGWAEVASVYWQRDHCDR